MNTIQKLCLVFLFFTLVTFFTSSVVYSQQRQFLKGTIERIKVHGKGLEANLSDDSADRFVSVYLPASYKKNPNKRYPVVYFLHGYTDDDAKFYGFSRHWMTLPPILDSVFDEGNVK